MEKINVPMGQRDAWPPPRLVGGLLVTPGGWRISCGRRYDTEAYCPSRPRP